MTTKKKMLSLAAVCLLVIVAVPVIAQQAKAAGNYQIRVMDAYSQELISEAEVEIGGRVYFVDDGYLDLDFSENSHLAYVSAPGYTGKWIELYKDYRYSCYLSPSYDTTHPPEAYVRSTWRWQDQDNFSRVSRTRQLELQELRKQRQIWDGDIYVEGRKIYISDEEVTARGILKVWVDFEQIQEFTSLEGRNGEAVVLLDETFFDYLDEGVHHVRVEFADQQYTILDLII